MISLQGQSKVSNKVSFHNNAFLLILKICFIYKEHYVKIKSKLVTDNTVIYHIREHNVIYDSRWFHYLREKDMIEFLKIVNIYEKIFLCLLEFFKFNDYY